MKISSLLTVLLICSCCTATSQLKQLDTFQVNSVLIAHCQASGMSGNGVIIARTGDTLYVATVAHLCDPIQAANAKLPTLAGLQLDDNTIAQVLTSVMEETRKCRLTYIVRARDQLNLLAITSLPIVVDYDNDLVISQVDLTQMRQTRELAKLDTSYLDTLQPVKLPTEDFCLELSPGDPLYAVYYVPGIPELGFVFGRVGNTMMSGPVLDEPPAFFMQTQLMIGPGASGGPVFAEGSDTLLGLIAMELTGPNKTGPKLRMTLTTTCSNTLRAVNEARRLLHTRCSKTVKFPIECYGVQCTAGYVLPL